MDKIIQTFKNIYSGENVVKKHLLILLLFSVPSIATTAFQIAYDKDFADLFWPMAITGGILSLISIPMLICIFGIFLKYINNRFHTEIALPNLDLEVMRTGIRGIPLFLVWTIYFIVIVSLISIIITSIFGLFDNLLISTWFTRLYMFLFDLVIILFIVGILLFVVFINSVYVIFAKDFNYNSDILNPLLVFKLMSKSFWQPILISLRYLLVSFVFNLVSIIVMFLIMMLGSLTLMFVYKGQFTHTMAGVIYIFMVTAFATCALSYVAGIISLAFADNLTEFYKNTFYANGEKNT